MVFRYLRTEICRWLHLKLGHPRWARKAKNALMLEDLWELFLQRVPPVVAEYFRGGADREITLRANSLAWQESLTTAWGAERFDETSDVDTSTTFIGFDIAVPYTISPVGSLALLYPEADAIASKVAGEFGTVMAQSTLSGTPMEKVTAASSGDCFFQLYLCYGRDASVERIERAKKAGFKALILTIDTARAGNRVEHARMKPVEAMSTLRGNIRVARQMIRRPSWLCSHYAGGGMIDFVNVTDENGDVMPYTDIGGQLAASAVTWKDLDWIKEAWCKENPNGKFIIKGVHNAEDARRAEDAGADAVCWSNHGGRQQDRVPSTLQIIAEEMPKMSGSQLEFMADGGIRHGGDFITGLSYGIKAFGLGRPVVAGIGAAGEDGLRQSLGILSRQFETSMRLIGVRNIAEIAERGEEIRRAQVIQQSSELTKFVF